MINVVNNLVILRFGRILQQILYLVSQIFRSTSEVLFQLFKHDLLLSLELEFTEGGFIQREKDSVDFTFVIFIEFVLTDRSCK